MRLLGCVMVRKNLLSMRLWKGGKIQASLAASPPPVTVMAGVHGMRLGGERRCIYGGRREQKTWCDWRQHVAPGSVTLLWGLQHGIPEASDNEPFTAGKGWLHRCRNRSGLKNVEITWEPASAPEDSAAARLAELQLGRAWYYRRFQASPGDPGTTLLSLLPLP